MRAGTFITLLLALLLGGGAAFLATSWLKSQASAKVTDARIVVAGRPLKFGTPLTAEDLAEIPWPAGRLPEGSFTSKQELLKEGTRVALAAMEKNEPVLQWKVTGPGQRASLSALINEDMRAVTIRVDDVRGVAGFVLPGERVDILLTQAEGRGNSISDVLLQNVRVLAVDQIVSEKQDKPTVARAVTLEVTTEQAQKVILAGDIGKLSLILRQAGAAESAQTRRVTRADLSVAEPPPAAPAAPVAAPELPKPPQMPVAATIGVVRGLERSVYTVVKEKSQSGRVN